MIGVFRESVYKRRQYCAMEVSCMKSAYSQPQARHFRCKPNEPRAQFSMEIFRLLVLSFCISFFSYLFVSQLLSQPVKFPESIPVVGLRKQWFKTTRASYRQLTDGIRTQAEGYRQVISTMKNLDQLN